MLVDRPKDDAGLFAPTVSATDHGSSGSISASSRSPSAIIRAVELILLLGLLLLIGRIVFNIFAPVPALDTAATASAAAPAPVVSGAEVIDNPFPARTVQAVAVVPATDYENVAETSLNIILKGVWPDGEGGGSAQINVSDNREYRFAIGDEIINGVSLERVLFDRVVILRNGVRESLVFENPPAKPAENNGRGSGSRKSASSNNPVLPALRGQQPPDIGAITEVVRFAPNRDDAGNVSVILNPGRNVEAFEDLGFRSGDALISIDGAPPPTDPVAMAEFVGNLYSKSRASIIVRRDNEEITVPVNISELGK